MVINPNCLAKYGFALAAVLSLCLGGARADEKKGPKGKNVDPPSLQTKDYEEFLLFLEWKKDRMKTEQKKLEKQSQYRKQPQGKESKMAQEYTQPKVQVAGLQGNLPPGLAKKPANHPGRMAYEQAMRNLRTEQKRGYEQLPPPKKNKKDKGD